MSQFYMARDRETGQIVGPEDSRHKKTARIRGPFQGTEKAHRRRNRFRCSIIRGSSNVLQYGMTLQGEQFLVMEFLDGPGLNSLIIGKNELLNGRRLQLIRQAAEALDAVHEAGYIHRDVCPRNFVVSPDGDTLKLDRLRPDRARHRSLHAARQPHGHAQLHGAGVGQAASRPTAGSTFSPSASAPTRFARSSFPGSAARRASWP